MGFRIEEIRALQRFVALGVLRVQRIDLDPDLERTSPGVAAVVGECGGELAELPRALRPELREREIQAVAGGRLLVAGHRRGGRRGGIFRCQRRAREQDRERGCREVVGHSVT
jgi:hypothetical protein